MDPLDPTNPYTFLPYLPSTPPLPVTHLPLTVLQTSSWTYSGPLLSPTALPSSLHTWSVAALSSPSELLRRLLPLLSFLDAYLKERGVQHYWITLRATTATGEYDVPRWHVDDDFFAGVGGNRDGGRGKGEGERNSDADADADADAGKTTEQRRWRWRTRSRTQTRRPKPTNADMDVGAGTGADEHTTDHAARQTKEKGKTNGKEHEGACDYKLCTTLLGPSTLFLPAPHHALALQTLCATKTSEAAKRKHLCASIRCPACGDTGDAVRTILATAFADLPTVQSQYGELSVFRTGEGGTVHSEPPCRSEPGRVFVNIVPGTEEGLRALAGRFGIEWPRSWCLGVPTWVDSDE